MNDDPRDPRDEQFDRLVKNALTMRAERQVAQQPPRRLAMRRLAVRLTQPATVSPSTSAPVASQPRLLRLTPAVAGLVVIVVVAAFAIGYVLGPGSQVGAIGPKFESVRFGYSVQLPDDTWSVYEAPGQWQLGTFLDVDTPGADFFTMAFDDASPPVGLGYVWIGSQPIPADMTYDGWLYVQDGVTADAEPCFQLQGSYEFSRLGGERVRIGAYYCPEFHDTGMAWSLVQYLVEHDGRGYALYFWPAEQGNLMPARDQLKLEARRWLATFTFTDDAGATP